MRKAFAAAVALFSATPCLAAVDDWTFDDSDGGCMIAMSYEGPGDPMLLFSKHRGMIDDLQDNDVIVAFTNDNWSLTAGDKVDDIFRFEADDESYFYGPVFAIEHGIGLPIDKKHVDHIRLASGLNVFKGKERVSALSLDGFTYAWSKFETCISKIRAPLIDAEEKRKLFESLPNDPFAKSRDANKPAPTKP